MIIKLLLILSLLYGFTVHSQTNKGLESLEERGEFVFKLPGHIDIEGETNPKHLTRQMENCLLSVNIESNNSIKLVFLDTETVQKFLCDILGTKIVNIDDKFLLFSDGHHVFEYLKLLEINKEQVVFEYTNKFLWGTTILTTKGILNWELD